jgi:ParB-like chromosome segregation protein Spo0J
MEVETMVEQESEQEKPIIKDEFKSIFPRLEKQEYAQLEESIAKEGCRDPILVWNDNGKRFILDGHHRYEICEAKGIKPEIKEISLGSEAEARIWIMKNQIGRRNLTRKQKRELIKLRLRDNPELSNRQISDELHANHRTVGAIRKQLESGGEILHLKTTIGKDGKKQPREKKRKSDTKSKESVPLEESKADNSKSPEITLTEPISLEQPTPEQPAPVQSIDTNEEQAVVELPIAKPQNTNSIPERAGKCITMLKELTSELPEVKRLLGENNGDDKYSEIANELSAAIKAFVSSLPENKSLNQEQEAA